MKLIGFLLALALLPGARVCAQRPATGLDSLFYGKRGLRVRYPDLGLSIGVVRGTTVAYYALGNEQPTTQSAAVDSTTLFEIGSITKTFTALLLALAQEKGELAAGAHLDACLPPGVQLRPALRHRVKLTAMASHQSGLPNLSNDRYIQALFDQDPAQPFHLVTRKYLYTMTQASASKSGVRGRGIKN